jgi:phosphatidylglycerophosphate synthase
VWSAVLLMTSVLLDWIDGPVARAYNQCTIFGSGVDWLADVLVQILTMCWWVQVCGYTRACARAPSSQRFARRDV